MSFLVLDWFAVGFFFVLFCFFTPVLCVQCNAWGERWDWKVGYRYCGQIKSKNNLQLWKSHILWDHADEKYNMVNTIYRKQANVRCVNSGGFLSKAKKYEIKDSNINHSMCYQSEAWCQDSTISTAVHHWLSKHPVFILTRGVRLSHCPKLCSM